MGTTEWVRVVTADGTPLVAGEQAREPDADEAAFRVLYPGLRRLAAVVSPPECDPDDLVQDALARVLARRTLAELDHPAAYLARTIVNLASNERRRLGRRRGALRRLGPPVEAENADYPSDLADLLALPPVTRAVLWMADVEGRSSDEIAAVVGGTAEAVRARASRARRQLRRTIEEET